MHKTFNAKAPFKTNSTCMQPLQDLMTVAKCTEKCYVSIQGNVTNMFASRVILLFLKEFESKLINKLFKTFN